MLNYIPHDVVREDRSDGSILLRSGVPLGPVAKNTGVWLHEWAEKSPDRVFVAERSGEGWRELRYAELLQQVRAVAASLLSRSGRFALFPGTASITRFSLSPGNTSACQLYP